MKHEGECDPGCDYESSSRARYGEPHSEKSHRLAINFDYSFDFRREISAVSSGSGNKSFTEFSVGCRMQRALFTSKARRIGLRQVLSQNPRIIRISFTAL